MEGYTLPRVDVVITEWALQSYLDLRARTVFTDAEYWRTIRPDVERLKREPTLPLQAPEFQNHAFWSAATDRNGRQIQDGFKMKWHNMGPGRVQLRLLLGIVTGRVFLCRAYVKDSAATDVREMTNLKNHIALIRAARFQYRGQL
jgi:hypothetical protein